MISAGITEKLRNVHDSHNGVDDLRAAVEAVDQESFDKAVMLLDSARKKGLPVEAEPWMHICLGLAMIGSGDSVHAIPQLAGGWHKFPDVAALPALIGIARFHEGFHRESSRMLLAALATDDPEDSLGAIKPFLGRMVSRAAFE